ncbi:MAG: hypothetical protein IJY57_03680 [Clostridia bacterium]|nr:hypothetical protein [Clostridia bacterium]
MATNMFSKIKNRILLILLAVLFACTSAFFLTACGDDESEFTEKDYSYEWTDEAKIVNGSFEFGTNGVTLDQYPYNSASNWSLSVDNAAQTSLITSGIVNTKTEAWTKLLSNLYDDSDFIAYAEKKWDFKVSDVKSANSGWTDEQVKNHIIETYLNETNFANPKAPVGADGSKVYMLNNYPSVTNLGGIGQGTAQKLVSSTSIALEKGSFGKITVFVQTRNIAHFGTASDLGANIRLSNTVSTTKQADYRISGINTETSGVAVDANGWAKYEIFVKADDFVDCSVIVEVGLGYGNGAANKAKDYCEGTVYFDDITFEEIEKTDYDNAITNGAVENVFEYEVAPEDALEVVAGTQTAFVYSMDLNKSIDTYASTFYSQLNPAIVNGSLTLGSDGTTTKGSGTLTKDYTGETCDYSNYLMNAEVTGASYTIRFGSYDAPVMVVKPESYANVVFYLKADLGEFNKKSITVLAYDVNHDLVTGDYAYAKAPRITINPTYDEDWVKVSFTLSNNFPEKDVDGKYADVEHAFFFEIVVGPTDILSTTANSDFVTGNVLVTLPEIATGKSYNFQRENYVSATTSAGNSYYTDYDIKEELPENRTDFNSYYSLAYSVSDAKEALFSAYLLDWTEKDDSVAYAMNVSPSAIGSILHGPANIDGFTGVSSNHGYINSESTNFVVNDRCGNGTTDGMAGVINTKYVGSYNNASLISSALNHTGSKDAQPLMIYNATANAYGFIGESLPLSANSSMQISVKVRVVGVASAYIYLVDTSSDTKKVMSIEVPVNTDGTSYLTGDDIQTKTGTMMFKVKSGMMRADEDGWVTVNFYIAAGNQSKNFRLELWNGARDGSDNSQGFVFFDEVITSGAFTESTSTNYLLAFTEGVLLDATIYDKGVVNESLLHKRELSETEVEYNNDSDRKNAAVAYPAKYVWVKTPTVAYAIFNSLEYDEVDPYASETEEDTEEKGCAAETDPATFWMQFSSILLGVALVFALVALIIKGVINRKKANANDAKSHYNVSSRYKALKDKKDKAQEQVETETEEETEVETVEEETATETEENTENAEQESESTLDEYVYGDVQDFGSDNDIKE